MLPFGGRVMYKYTAVPTGNLDQRWGHGIWVGKAPMTGEHIILKENGVQKARPLHPRAAWREIRDQWVEESARTSLERQGGKLESDDCDATGPRPTWTSTCVLDDQGRGKAWYNVWLQWLCRCGTTHRSLPSAMVTRERVQVQSERESDRSLSLPLSPRNQHRRHSVFIIRSCCADANTKHSERADGFTDGVGSTQNAESTRERGQARCQQVKCGCWLRGSQHDGSHWGLRREHRWKARFEVRKGRAKEVRELDEFEVKMEVDESEMRMTPGKKIRSTWV